MTGPNAFKLGTCTVPPGTSGPWAIEAFEVSEAEARFQNIRAAFSGGRGFEEIRAGKYKRLKHERRGVVMSNTRMEIMTNFEAYRASTGRVLINGLGLGMLLEAILAKPDVTYVRVIELDADVIKLVAPHFAADKRVEVINADALAYKPARGERFNYAWHDIWDGITGDNLAQMATLGRRYGRRVADAQGWWARDIIRDQERRWR